MDSSRAFRISEVFWLIDHHGNECIKTDRTAAELYSVEHHCLMVELKPEPGAMERLRRFVFGSRDD